MRCLKVAVIHIGEDAIGIEVAISFVNLLKGAGHKVVLGTHAETAAARYCKKNGGQWDELRMFTWLVMSSEEFSKTFDKKCDGQVVVRPLDGGLDFRDCDYWIITGGLPNANIAQLVPYGVYVSDHIAILRKAGIEYAEVILDILHGAHSLLFASSSHANEWRAMALSYDAPILLGKPPTSTMDKKGQKFIPPKVKSLIYFPTPHQFTLLPALLGLPAPDGHALATVEQVTITPLRERNKKKSKLRPLWRNGQTIQSSIDLIPAMIAECEFVLIGPLADPQDFRLQIAQQLGKPVLMFWSEEWASMPEILEQNVKLIAADNIDGIEKRIIAAFEEKQATTGEISKERSAKSASGLLDAKALTSVMEKGAGL